MSVELVVRLITRWELLLVAGLVMLLIPLVCYLAAGRPGPARRRFVPPADRALARPERAAGS